MIHFTFTLCVIGRFVCFVYVTLQACIFFISGSSYMRELSIQILYKILLIIIVVPVAGHPAVFFDMFFLQKNIRTFFWFANPDSVLVKMWIFCHFESWLLLFFASLLTHPNYTARISTSQPQRLTQTVSLFFWQTPIKDVLGFSPSRSSPASFIHIRMRRHVTRCSCCLQDLG